MPNSSPHNISLNVRFMVCAMHPTKGTPKELATQVSTLALSPINKYNLSADIPCVGQDMQ